MGDSRDMTGPGIPKPKPEETEREKAVRQSREMGILGLRQEDNYKEGAGWPRWKRISDPNKVIDPRDKDAPADLLTFKDNGKLEDNTYELATDPYKDGKTTRKLTEGMQNLEFERKKHYITVKDGKMFAYGLSLENDEAFKKYYGAMAQQIARYSDTLVVDIGDTKTMPQEFYVKRILLYIEMAQKNNLAIAFGPETEALIQSFDAKNRQVIDDLVLRLQLNKERTNLIVGATQDFSNLNNMVGQAKPWEVPAGTANKAAWVDTHIQNNVYEATFTEQQKADALNKELKLIEDELKHVTDAHTEVENSLNTYETILSQPSKIGELPPVDIKYNGGFWSKLWDAPPEVVKQKEKDLADPEALVESVKEYNAQAKTSREALLTSLDKKRENLQEYLQGLKREAAKLDADLVAHPLPAGATEIQKADRKKLETQLEATQKQVKELETKLQEATTKATKSKQKNDQLDVQIANAAVREANKKAAAAAAAARHS